MISGIFFSQVCIIIDTKEVGFLVYTRDNVIFYILKHFFSLTSCLLMNLITKAESDTV